MDAALPQSAHFVDTYQSELCLRLGVITCAPCILVCLAFSVSFSLVRQGWPNDISAGSKGRPVRASAVGRDPPGTSNLAAEGFRPVRPSSLMETF